MEIKRHEASKILSEAVEHGNTVYLAGIVADDPSQDVKGQTKQVLDKIDRLLAACGSHKPARACVEAKLADPRMLVEIMIVAAR